MFSSVCDCKAPLHPFLRWWTRELFIHCIGVSTVYIENVNILQSTLVLISWSQSELLSLSEPEYLCTCNYEIKFCEWFANICEILYPCDLHQREQLCSDRLCVELWLTCDEGGTSPSSVEPAAMRSHLSWWTASHSWWVSSVKYRRGQTQSCNQYKQFVVVVTHLGINVKLPVKCNPVTRVALHLHFTVGAVHWWEIY